MKKILPFMAIIILVLSGLGATAFSVQKQDSLELTATIRVSAPVLKINEEYAVLQLKDVSNFLHQPGFPQLPMVTQSFDLPFGARNIQITCTYEEEHEVEITNKIIPSPQAISTQEQATMTSLTPTENLEIYASNERYPANHYDAKITCGLNSDNKRVTHISLYLFPVQYVPASNMLYYIEDMEIKITYDPPVGITGMLAEEYDLVIIAPDKFSSNLQKLVDHKNENNVKTFLKTTEEIYDEYEGDDKPEQIKYFIKDAIETYNISYVLLVGGLKRYYLAKDRDDPNQGTRAWHVPVRYTNIKKSGTSDPGCATDLYYADIYKYEGNSSLVFEDWDPNDDGYYAHWGKFVGVFTDILDYNPDVFVSRLPCRNRLEVQIVVNKIINYEETTPGSKPWFTKIVGIAGQSHDIYEGQPDGEYLCDIALQYMENKTTEELRVYASNENTGDPIPVPEDIIPAISDGAGFISFQGHGHPLRWDTHPVDDISVWMGGIHQRDFYKLTNKEKLPIIVVGGCHNGQFNITWFKTRRSPQFGDDQFYWTHGDPGAICFNWKLLTIPWGGAVASVGCTGLSTSWVGEPVSLNSELDMNFFYTAGQTNTTTFGQAFYGAVQKFIDENPIYNTEAHSLTIFQPFGDPSLIFGGYS